MIAHIVSQGDCIGCLAYQYGHLPKTIWDDSANQELKDLRKDPNVLFEDDVVQIPDLRLKEEACAAEQKHRFKRKAVPQKLHLELRLQDRKLANEEFELVIGSKTTRGSTDGNGRLEAKLMPHEQNGWLRIRGRKILFTLGTLNPAATTTGQQQRLNQLGYPCGQVDGVPGPRTAAGFRAFQKAKGLTENGQADQPTIAKLKEDYGG
ncbi:MAG: hypothetical protein QOJ40_2377 [Verrucomicrobiota bacterium]